LSDPIKSKQLHCVLNLRVSKLSCVLIIIIIIIIIIITIIIIIIIILLLRMVITRTPN